MSTAASPIPIALRFAAPAEKRWLCRLPSRRYPSSHPRQFLPRRPKILSRCRRYRYKPRRRASASGICRYRRRSNTLRNVALVAVVVTVVIVIAIAMAGPSPQTSLENGGGTALINQDAPAFDNYVDLQSILSDWTDQAASSWLSNNNSGGDALVANGLVVGFKSLLLPKLASSVEQEILSHQVSDQPQTNGTDNTANYLTGFLFNGIRTLITSQLQYKGVAAQTKSGTDAVLDVRFVTGLSSSPIIVRVRMQRMGDHWRIVAIPDVEHLLARLHPPATASLPSLQTGLQPLPDSASNLRDTTPEAPATAPSPPPAPEKTTKEPDDDPIGEGGFITPPTR